MASPRAPPVIDISAVYKADKEAKNRLLEQVKSACQEFGFFQVVNHNVPAALQDGVLAQAEAFFSLPLSTKEKYDKDIGGFNRGYERLRAQNFEKRTEGDLKEGFYIGTDLPPDHPYVVAGKINMGPNKYPEELEKPDAFRETVDEYFAGMTGLANDILRILALTLGLDEDWFKDFTDTPMAILRLLHYPPQAPDASELERGIGAHTDFGGITILLQDMVGGLQVWSKQTSKWVDVTPMKGAFVVNLGNLMMRWTNNKYLSNLHRVINKTGRERYSVPFFFSGNPDFVVSCLPNCEDAHAGAKYPPITVDEWMRGRYAETYGSKGEAMGDLANGLVEAST